MSLLCDKPVTQCFSVFIIFRPLQIPTSDLLHVCQNFPDSGSFSTRLTIQLPGPRTRHREWYGAGCVTVRRDACSKRTRAALMNPASALSPNTQLCHEQEGWKTLRWWWWWWWLCDQKTTLKGSHQDVSLEKEYGEPCSHFTPPVSMATVIWALILAPSVYSSIYL